ncbi:MAG TPA: hypothetical protein VMV86_05830 [Methanosarcinales archaeon]|nr:hypothetical protein [Methanosarcinales archaeon]
MDKSIEKAAEMIRRQAEQLGVTKGLLRALQRGNIDTIDKVKMEATVALDLIREMEEKWL